MQALSIGLALSLALAPLAPAASVSWASSASATLSEPPSTTREGAEIPYGPEPEVGVIDIVPPEPPPKPEPEPDPPPPKIAEPVAEPEAPPPPPPPKVEDRLGCDGSKPCQKMTIAGIVVGVLGVGAVVTGTALLVNKDEVVPESPALVRSTQPAGLVATTIGAGVTVTAVLMLVAAHQGYKRDADTRARVRLGPGGLQF